jgi:XTP/dITP diphosphohydrolase
MTLAVPVRQLLVATGNRGKLRELSALFEGLPFELLSLTDLGTDIPAPEETGATFAENARLKAVAYARAAGLPCLADDSGFVVAALDGRPGVLSARVPGDDDAARVQWVYRELDARGGRKSAAAFVCAMALAAPDGSILHETEGRVDGEIAPEPRGDGGFGYDPIFFYPPAGRTFAEMSRDEKAAVSHRGVAARAMREWLAASARANDVR